MTREILPAELDRALRSVKQPEYDKNGKCLHVRAYYVRVGMSSVHECPDCKRMFFHGEPRGKADAR